MCGTKCWGSLEGCREKELCYTGTGVAAGLGGCPSTTQLCQTHTPCPSVQVGMGKHTSSHTERSAVVKISAALSSCACVDGWLCGFQNWQCRSQRCGGKKSPGVLGSVQNVDGKTTNCSAVQSKVSMWMCLSSYPAQSCVWQCCVSSGFPVQDEMGCLCLGREEVWCWFCACGSEGLGVAEALWDVTLGYWHQDWWADCKFLWHHWGRRSLPAAGKCWLWRSAFSPATLPSAAGTCTALCSHSSRVLGGTGGTWPCTDMVPLEMGWGAQPERAAQLPLGAACWKRCYSRSRALQFPPVLRQSPVSESWCHVERDATRSEMPSTPWCRFGSIRRNAVPCYFLSAANEAYDRMRNCGVLCSKLCNASQSPIRFGFQPIWLMTHQ